MVSKITIIALDICSKWGNKDQIVLYKTFYFHVWKIPCMKKKRNNRCVRMYILQSNVHHNKPGYHQMLNHIIWRHHFHITFNISGYVKPSFSQLLQVLRYNNYRYTSYTHILEINYSVYIILPNLKSHTITSTSIRRNQSNLLHEIFFIWFINEHWTVWNKRSAQGTLKKNWLITPRSTLYLYK